MKTEPQLTPAPVDGTKPRLLIVIAAGLCLLGLIVFGQVRTFHFVNFDDDVFVTQNAAVNQGLTAVGVSQACRGGIKGLWHPLTYVSLMADVSLFGLRPGPMHVVNLLLHLASTVLLFLLLRQLLARSGRWSAPATLWVSAFTAAAFAVHPLQVEPVAWIASRKDVLSTFLLILTIRAYAWYSGHRNLRRYVLTVVVFALGLMAKPMLISVPLVLLLLDVWPLGNWVTRDWLARWQYLRRRLWEKVPLLVLAAVVTVITVVAQQHAGAVTHDERLLLSDRLQVVPASYLLMFGRALVPLRLCCFYPHPVHFGAAVSHGLVIAGVLLLAVASGLVLALVGRRPWWAVGWLWFVIMLVPVSGIIQIGGHLTADRYTYAPMIGLFFGVAAGLAHWWQQRRWSWRWLVLASLVPLAAWVFLARRQAATWKTSETLWQQALAVDDRNFLAHNQLGLWLYGEGRVEEAAAHFEKAGAAGSDAILPLLNQASLEIRRGDYAAAAAVLERGLKLESDNLKARNLAAYVQGRLGNPQQAEDLLRGSLQLAPGDPETTLDLAKLLIEQQRAGESLPLLQAALGKQARSVELLNTLAAAQAQLGNLTEARNCLQQVLAIDPGNRLARRNLEKLGGVNR